MKKKNGFIATSLKIFTHWSLHTTKLSPGFRERYPSPKNVHILDPVMAELTHPVNLVDVDIVISYYQGCVRRKSNWYGISVSVK